MINRLVLFTILALLSNQGVCQSDVYKVAFRHMPSTLSPIDNQRMAGSFLIWQMVYPLVSIDKQGQISSKVLDLKKTRSLDSTFNQFQFCLLPGLLFSDQSQATASDLTMTFSRLKKTVEGFSHIRTSTRVNSDCIKITLAKRDLRFFEKLTGVAASLYKFDQAKPLSLIAVGDYRLMEQQSAQITLVANTHIEKESVFKKIVLKIYQPSDTWKDTDLNFVSGDIAPPALLSQFNEVIPPTKRVYAIVVNLKNVDERRCFASLVDPIAIGNLMKIHVKPIPGFIPSEMIGSNEQFLPEKVPQNLCKPNMAFIWNDFRESDKESINAYFSSLANRFGVRFKVTFQSLESLIALSESGKEYITVISFNSAGSKDSWNSDSTVFFEPFLREKKVISTNLSKLRKAVDDAAMADLLSQKTEKLSQAHRLLLDSGFVYPLGEVSKNFYVPKKISLLPWADRVSGIPQISGIR
jgi:hypothetical protein